MINHLKKKKKEEGGDVKAEGGSWLGWGSKLINSNIINR